MTIPFLSFFGKKEKSEYFLALLLRDEKVSAVIFEQSQGKIRTIGKEDEFFENTIEQIPLDRLLEIIDQVIAKAEETLPSNIETQKTVFGLKETWIEDAKIKKDYLLKLKKISSELGLLPIGFLVIQEAIAHLLQEEEGAPVSAILIEVGNKNLTLSILRASRIIDTKRVEIEESVAKTTDKLLHYFENCEVLPSRVILFNSKDDEKLQQEFISHSWSKSLPFLHVPQITILPVGFAAQAILSGTATQMGFEMIDKEPQIAKQKEIKEEVLTKGTEREITEEKELQGFEEEMLKENFGFRENEDVVEKSKEDKLKEITSEKPIEKKEVKKELQEEFLQETDIIEAEEFQEKESKLKIHFRIPNFLNILISKIKIIKNPFSKTQTTEFQKSSSFKNKKIIFIPLVILFFIIPILFLYLFCLKATLTIFVNPKIIEKRQNITFSTNTSTNFSKNILASEIVSITEDGDLIISVTGKKEIGEKAKGKVVIYSRFTEEKIFPSGTVITSSNNLQFTLDESVKLASVSADASATPISAKVSVTAKNIGKESNLPSGAKFTFGSQPASIIIAKNETAFSGGSKKEITAVSKTDLDKLTTELPKKLEGKAKEDLAKKIPNDLSVLPIFTKTTLTKKEFSQKINDEANNVGIKATVSYQGLAYKKSELEEYLKDLFQNDIRDMLISKNGVEYDIKEAKLKSEKEIQSSMSVKISLLPKIDTKKLTSDLAGKSFDDTKKIISKLPQMADIEISLSPKLPFLPKLLPHSSKNIIMIVKTNE